uniref:O-methyltransferase C-terminal domain-containing protein n=1 Tax=Salix viminalis TaxID=40686 RepID=A0A6N2LTL4_SALVM
MDCLSTWFQDDEVTAFSVAHEKTVWEYAGLDPRFNNLVNDAMASDSILTSKLVVSKCKGIFDGVNSLVDVGGGVGTMAKAISEAFPHIDCTVFDLLHVVSDLQGSKNLKYAGEICLRQFLRQMLFYSRGYCITGVMKTA